MPEPPHHRPGGAVTVWGAVPVDDVARHGAALSSPPAPRAAVPVPDSVGGDDVAASAVLVMEQRDPRRAVRIVLDARDLGADAVLVAAKIHDPVALLVPAADPAHGDVAVVVPAARLVEALRQ